MKNLIKSTLVAVLITSSAMAGINPIKKTVKVKESNIVWTGKKVLGSHTGTISLKSGELEMDGEALTGGNFVVDMTTITVTDLETGKGKEKLEGHLNSPDFFDTANHQEATFVITEATKNGNAYDVTGDLTIKGITEQITLQMNITAEEATTTIEVDRTKFGVRYGSASFFDNLKDNAISDTFELAVTLKL